MKRFCSHGVHQKEYLWAISYINLDRYAKAASIFGATFFSMYLGYTGGNIVVEAIRRVPVARAGHIRGTVFINHGEVIVGSLNQAKKMLLNVFKRAVAHNHTNLFHKPFLSGVDISERYFPQILFKNRRTPKGVFVRTVSD